jgi:hypothetical protein
MGGIIPEALFEATQRRLEKVAAMKGHGGGREPKGAHLLTHGLLRCSRCGSAMIARTDTRTRDGGQWYICDGRERRGKEFCSQPWVRREDIDEPLLAELDKYHLDHEAMVERMQARLSYDQQRVAGVIADLERQAAQRDERFARAEEDYLDRKITPEQWARLDARLTEEGVAIGSALERAKDQEAQLTEAAPRDAEEEVLRRLADLRHAVLEGVRTAPNVTALRQVLRRIFKRVLLVEVNGRARLYPDARLDQHVFYDFYQEHGRLPSEPGETDWRHGDDVYKRVALDLDEKPEQDSWPSYPSGTLPIPPAIPTPSSLVFRSTIV